jgi:hypothetical protein
MPSKFVTFWDFCLFGVISYLLTKKGLREGWEATVLALQLGNLFGHCGLHTVVTADSQMLVLLALHKIKPFARIF